MKLIVGLGNPGSKYTLTRHNIGFIISDYFANYCNLKFTEGKGDWFQCSARLEGCDFYIIKPTTFMNNSGNAVYDFILKNDISISDILIIYDDIHIPLGTIRIRMKGSDGGHNGISSIIYKLNTLEFPRMRIGIGRDKPVKKDEYTDFVLSNFEADELDNIKTLLPVYKDCITAYIREGLRAAMNKYNKNFLPFNEGKESSEKNNQIQNIYKYIIHLIITN